MQKNRFLFGAVLCLSFFSSCSNKVVAVKESSPNILTRPWAGPYGGVPPFDKVKISDFKPALEQAMNDYRNEISKIADNPEPPTFENTLVAMENSGRMMDRVNAVYYVWSANRSTPEFQAVEQEMAPKLAAFGDEIIQNEKLFKRIEAVYKSKDFKKLKPEDQRLSWYHYTRFKLQGAELNADQKKKVSDINQRLAVLTTQFSQNVMADEANDALVIQKKSDLDGLPQDLVDAAAAEASRRNLKDAWVIANTRSSMEPFLTYAKSRELREKAFRIWSVRGDQNNKNNNNKVVSEILQLRTEYAKILGYPTYAHWRMADSMMKDPNKAMKLMLQVWKPAVAQAKRDVAEMQKIVNKEKGGFQIQPWDYRYYQEKIRKQKYDLDFDIVKPYLQLVHIREAMFWAAFRLYGLTFERITDLPVFNDQMSVYKVTRNGDFVGLWYFDPYARPGKSSGAWMNAYRDQNNLNGHLTPTIVSNNANFVPPKPGDAVLISWDDAITMFHEFGHALHGLNSNVTYPSLSGTNTPRDFVEFPSQFNENYLLTKEVMKMLINQEGQPLPNDLVAKIEKAKNYDEGFRSVEFLASAIVDMKLHLATETIDPKRFEETTLKEIGMPSEIIMRHRIPHFGHLFSSDGYAAGYYGYLWSDVLKHDAYEAFLEHGGPYSQKMAKKFQKYILSVGNTVDEAKSYRLFRGRDPKVDALLRARGFSK